MKKILLISQRELKRRLRSRSFIALSFIGPLVVIAFIFTAIWSGLGEVEKTNVLISDPHNVFHEYLRADTNSNVEFYFTSDVISNGDFVSNKSYSDFNIKIDINEKILENSTSIMVYKKLPTIGTESFIKRSLQNNLEEMKALQFKYASLEEYYKIKQPMQLIGYDAVDGIYGQQKRESIIVGVFFGILVFIFIFVFSIQIMRSVLEEKSNRVIEIIASSVRPQQLLVGKIFGVALAGIVQFIIWFVLIFLSLVLIRLFYFPDLYDPSSWNFNPEQQNIYDGYGSTIELIYERINFTLMLTIFGFYFILGYLFYGTIYATLGGIVRSETDTQSFLIPVSIPLIVALVFIFSLIFNSNQNAIGWMSIFPLTSPVVMPVRVALGFEPGTVWELYLSMFLLFLIFLLMIYFAGKIYKRGILNYESRVRISTIFKWLRN